MISIESIFWSDYDELLVLFPPLPYAGIFAKVTVYYEPPLGELGGYYYYIFINYYYFSSIVSYINKSISLLSCFEV